MNLRDIQAESESENIAGRAPKNVPDGTALELSSVAEATSESIHIDEDQPVSKMNIDEVPTLDQSWPMTTDFQDILRIKPKFDTRKLVVIMLGCSAAIIMIIIASKHRTTVPKQAMNMQKLPDTVKSQPPPFAYLVPKQNNDWVSHASEVLFDTKFGVAKYNVEYTSDKANIVITQQQFPEKLKPRSGLAFQQFIVDSRPTQTVQLGQATLYFIASPGQPANGGKAAIIYVTESVLLFARSNAAIDAAHWVKLMGSLQETPGGR